MKNSGSQPASFTSEWDWEKGKKTVVVSVLPKDPEAWQEELYVSPDGTHMAAVVRLEDDSFTLRVNDGQWEQSFEKAWMPRFAPDGRLTALVMEEDQWTVAVDGTPWDERFDFIWNTMFGGQSQIYASIQSDMQYGMCKEGEPWPELHANATDFSLSPTGKKSAAVVQIVPLKQADLEAFAKGAYTVAVNGTAWEQPFVNAWTPVFNCLGEEQVAAQVRLNEFEYTIAINGIPWPTTYNCVWAPSFDPVGSAVAAPFRKGGRWGMTVDGAEFWKPTYYQCWNQQWSFDAKKLWAIVAPEYGKFTVACNNTPWNALFPVVTDLVLSPQGTRAAALASHKNEDFRVVVDGVAWNDSWDMAYPPVFSPDGQHVAALVRKKDTMTVFIDNKPVGQTFTKAWQPAFSPDSSSLLLRGVQNGALVRCVLPLNELF